MRWIRTDVESNEQVEGEIDETTSENKLIVCQSVFWQTDR